MLRGEGCRFEGVVCRFNGVGNEGCNDMKEEERAMTERTDG